MTVVIVRVYENKKSHQKLVSIPAASLDILPGDYVKIEKVVV